MKKTSALWTAEQYYHQLYTNHVAVGPFPGCSCPKCAHNHAGRVMCVAALRGEKCRFLGSSGYHNAAVPGTDDPGLPTTGSGSHPGC